MTSRIDTSRAFRDPDDTDAPPLTIRNLRLDQLGIEMPGLDPQWRDRIDIVDGAVHFDDWLIVEADGTIRVYDGVAGHYSVLHSMSEPRQAFYRELAAKIRERVASADRVVGANVFGVNVLTWEGE